MIKLNEILDLSLFKNFKIICGKEYLNYTVNAAVILEYESSRIHYEGYCYGYFVLLSYFFADTNPELVHGTIRTLIEKQVSGIAIKISPKQQFPQELITLALEYHVPLFAFYEEFMEDLIICINESQKTRAQYIIQEEMLNSIVTDKHTPESIEQTALTINPDFLPNVITASITSKDTSDNLKIHTFFDNLMYRQYQNPAIRHYSFVKSGHGLMLICSFPDKDIPPDITVMLNHIFNILKDAGFTPNTFYIGICDTVVPLNSLNVSVIKSQNANIVCQYFEQDYMSYSSLGIYKYIMTVVTNPIQYQDIEQNINILQQYDARHDSNLLESLIVYVKNNGDYMKTSNELYQHTNTVRYRIKKASQLLSLPDSTASDEIFFMIRSYLLHLVLHKN